MRQRGNAPKVSYGVCVAPKEVAMDQMCPTVPSRWFQAVPERGMWPRAKAAPEIEPRDRSQDREFATMERAFRGSGGFVPGDDVALMLRRHTEQPISTLARWIVDRCALHIEWVGEKLMPRFQFDAQTSLRPEVVVVTRELAGLLDDWELTLWFASTNSWLGDARPVDVLPHDPGAVLHAARADRFVARG
jgi:hypothetical protein